MPTITSGLRAYAAALLLRRADAALEAFLLRVFDHFGVGVEDLGERTYLLRGHRVTTDSFPEIPSEGLVGPFKRPHALGREDVSLLSSFLGEFSFQLVPFRVCPIAWKRWKDGKI